MLPIMSNGCESWIGTGSEAGFLLGYAPIYLRTSRDHQQLSHLDACPNIIYIYINTYIHYVVLMHLICHPDISIHKTRLVCACPRICV